MTPSAESRQEWWDIVGTPLVYYAVGFVLGFIAGSAL